MAQFLDLLGHDAVDTGLSEKPWPLHFRHDLRDWTYSSHPNLSNLNDVRSGCCVFSRISRPKWKLFTLPVIVNSSEFLFFFLFLRFPNSQIFPTSLKTKCSLNSLKFTSKSVKPKYFFLHKMLLDLDRNTNQSKSTRKKSIKHKKVEKVNLLDRYQGFI